MNILIPDSWLREYLDTDATAKEIKEYLSLCGLSVEKITPHDNDFVYEIEITSNRVDMASIFGIALEAAAILPRFSKKAKLRKELPQNIDNIKVVHQDDRFLQPENIDPVLCPRFAAVVIDNVTIKPSPSIIAKRLELSGIRSLNNVVDISNYLMIELGQPIHTFDYDKILDRKMTMRLSKKGEKIITLDGKEITLPGGDIVFADGKGRIIDLCGVMGAQNSSINDKTTHVLFFVQTYSPSYIRRTSMMTGQRSFAATLFEKGLDPERVWPTLILGIEMMRMTDGKVASPIYDIYPHPLLPKKIKTTVEFINERVGVELKKEEIVNILKSLSFQISESPKNIEVIPPTFRQLDVTIPEDIVEEVARIYGYHKLPNKLMTGDIPLTDKPKDFPTEEKIKSILKYWGYTEVYNYSFVSEKLIEKVGTDKNYPLKIANPLTQDTTYMRVSLVPSMLETISKNQFFKEKLSLFELAKVYIPRKNDLPEEISLLTIANQNSFYELKGIVEKLLEELGITDYYLLAKEHPYWHPQQAINFAKGDLLLLTIGKIHPKLATNFEIRKDLYVAEVNVDRLVAFSKPIKRYIPIPLYPEVIEDLTLNFPPKTQIGPIISEIYKVSSLIKKVEVIDRYQNSITLQITYQHKKRNLESSDIQNLRRQILQTLKSKFDTTLKK